MKKLLSLPSGVGSPYCAATGRKFLHFALCFLALFMVTLPAKAADFYAEFRVSISGTGGKIRVIQEGTGDINDLSQYTTTSPTSCKVKAGKGVAVNFEIGAASTTRGKKFGGWSVLGGSGSPAFVTGSRSTAQASVTMKASSGSLGGLLGGTNTATITANFIDDPDQVDVTYLTATNGSYTVAGPDGYGTVTVGNGSFYTTYSGDAITLSATPATGYTFIRYYTIDEGGNIATLGELYKAEQIVSITGSGSVSVCADFATQPYAIGARTFETLDAALQAVKTTTSKTIMVLKDVTVPAGRYTIPAGVTLLIPRDKNQTSPDLLESFSPSNATAQASSAYRKWTLNEGVSLIVNGAIEVGGKQGAGGQGANGAGIVTGSFGQLIMMTGSSITLNDGAILYAWGFVTGDIDHKDVHGNVPGGTIDARRGSKVYEHFQMYDWRGGTIESGLMGNPYDVFPMNTYFIQNVEVPTTYHPGASLITVTSINVSGSIIVAKNIQMIGVYNRIDGKSDDVAMFLMDDADTSDDTWVRKEYSASDDRQMYVVNSSARLGAISIELKGAPLIGDIKFDSKDYVLPVTSNLKIHLLSGEMRITQSTVLLPGAEIEIDKTATVTINANQSLYLYDSDEWGQYVFQDKYANQIGYAAAFKGKPNKRTLTSAAGLGDATINVHGTFDVEGALYTTAGGANVFSTIADAGTVHFTAPAPSDGTVSQTKNYTTGTVMLVIPALTDYDHFDATCTSAQLRNGDKTGYSAAYNQYTPTIGTLEGKSFCFLDMDGDNHGEWVQLTVEDECFVYDNNGIYYAKPADYVALKNGKTENPDHTYSSASGSRTFILTGGCQWWEVVYHPASGLYYCEKNDTYYYYDEDDEWIPKTYTITWENYDGTILKDEKGANIVYEVPYGSMPEFRNSTPSRPDDPGYYVYDFIGWSPAFVPVTDDVTYVAQYERNPVMYTITWNNANGSEREVGYFTRDQMPVCRTEPTGMGTSWEWNPVVEPVTGNKTYTLQAITTPKTSFTVTWKNYNGSTLQTLETDTDVPTGTTPEYNGAAPTKAPLADVRFVWNSEDGWTPAISPVTADIVYVAKYTEQPITYTVTWNNYNDDELLVQDVTPNTVPQYNGATPTKPSDADNNYVFNGWTPTVVAATENATYTATYATVPKDKVVGGAEPTYELPSGIVTVSNLIIKEDGKVTIGSSGRINATNLILEGTSVTSGQFVANANTNINLSGDAYFDWTPNGDAGTQARTWYAVAVPWEVDAESGIILKDNGRTLRIGVDFDMIYYNGDKRAKQGNVPGCWEYVQWDVQGHDRQGTPRSVDKTVHPGRLYMMYFDPGFKTIRFVKKAGASVMYQSSVGVQTYAESTNNNGMDANWNGIANPRTYFASLSVGNTYAQVLSNGNLENYFAPEGSPVYLTINLAASTFFVGQALFVQSTAAQPITVTKVSNADIVTAAPRRVREANLPNGIEAIYRLAIAGEGQPEADNLFVQVAEDEKADRYTIGQDLVKGGVASKRAQMWVNRYDAKLSVNTQALSNNEASYPLTIQIPANGEYTLSAGTTDNEEYALYLTKDGVSIWNLSNGAYTGMFDKGTSNEYGLRITTKAPQIGTGIDEAVVDAQGETRKVIINEKVYIIRGERVYSVDGQLIK